MGRRVRVEFAVGDVETTCWSVPESQCPRVTDTVDAARCAALDTNLASFLRLDCSWQLWNQMLPRPLRVLRIPAVEGHVRDTKLPVWRVLDEAALEGIYDLGSALCSDVFTGWPFHTSPLLCTLLVAARVPQVRGHGLSLALVISPRELVVCTTGANGLDIVHTSHLNSRKVTVVWRFGGACIMTAQKQPAVAAYAPVSDEDSSASEAAAASSSNSVYGDPDSDSHESHSDDDSAAASPPPALQKKKKKNKRPAAPQKQPTQSKNARVSSTVHLKTLRHKTEAEYNRWVARATKNNPELLPIMSPMDERNPVVLPASGERNRVLALLVSIHYAGSKSKTHGHETRDYLSYMDISPPLPGTERKHAWIRLCFVDERPALLFSWLAHAMKVMNGVKTPPALLRLAMWYDARIHQRESVFSWRHSVPLLRVAYRDLDTKIGDAAREWVDADPLRRMLLEPPKKMK